MSFDFAIDGSARIGADHFTATIATATEPASQVTVTSDGVDTGQWSAVDGALVYETGDGQMTTAITVNVAGMTVDLDDQHLFGDAEYRYTCAGDTMTLQYAGPTVLPVDRRPRFTLLRGD